MQIYVFILFMNYAGTSYALRGLASTTVIQVKFTTSEDGLVLDRILPARGASHRERFDSNVCGRTSRRAWENSRILVLLNSVVTPFME